MAHLSKLKINVGKLQTSLGLQPKTQRSPISVSAVYESKGKIKANKPHIGAR